LANSIRPDLTQAVHHLARFVSKPSQQDVVAIKRVFRYLNGTRSNGIIFQEQPKLTLVGYADADFASNITDPRSTSGFLFSLNGPISWSSRRQQLTALSTTEAELYALSEATREAQWLQGLLAEMTIIPCDDKPIIYKDNVSGLKIVQGHKLTARTRHLAVRIQAIRDIKDHIMFKQCPTAEMLADPPTKALGPIEFHRKMSHLVTERPADHTTDSRNPPRDDHDYNLQDGPKNLRVTSSGLRPGSNVAHTVSRSRGSVEVLPIRSVPLNWRSATCAIICLVRFITRTRESYFIGQ
jgi:hypothetical protein